MVAGRAIALVSSLLLAFAGFNAPAAAQPAQPLPAKAASMPRTATAKVPDRPARGAPATDLGYAIEPEPGWITPAPAGEDAPLSRAPMHYALLDYQFHADADGNTRFERAIRVVNEPAGLDTASQIQVEFDPTWQKLSLHRLRVTRAGKASDRLEPRYIKLLQRETQLERQMVDGRMTASIVLDDIRVGDRIEASFSVRGRNPVFEGKFLAREWMVAMKGPVSLFRVRLLAPIAREIHVKAPADAAVSRRDFGTEREIVFERHSVPQLQLDGFVPESSLLAEEVDFSEFGSWREVAAWAQRTFAVSPGDGLTAKAAEISAAAALPSERLALALDFVQREVRYFGTEIGPSSHRPAAPDTVLRQRFGDCKDKVTLLVALLREMGIDATPTIVSTHFRDAVGGMLPSPLDFDHVIARVRLGDQTYWLDATRARQTGPVARRQAAGLGRGLLADESASSLVDLPSLVREERMSVTDTFQWESIPLDPVLHARVRYRGELAEAARDALGAHSDLEVSNNIVEQYGRFYPRIRLRGPMRHEEVAGDNAIDFLLDFDVPGYLKSPGAIQLSGDFAFWSLVQAASHTNDVLRTRPFRISAPGTFRHAVVFEFPEDVYKEFRPFTFDEQNNTFTLHWATEGGARHVRTSAELTLLVDQIEPAAWANHLAKLDKVKERMGGTNRITSIPLAGIDPFKARAQELQDAITRGKIKVVTKEEAEANFRNLMLSAALDGGRLPPGPRADALVARGTALDHMGRAAEGARDFEEALRIAPDRADAFEAAGVNALMRRQDARAVELTEKSIELSGSRGNPAPRYTRAMANYFQGHFGAARDEFAEVIQNLRGDVPRSYGAIWLYMATRRAGGDGLAAIRDFRPIDSAPAWPYAVIEYLRGSRSLDDAEEATKESGKVDPGRACELWYYAAEKSLLDGEQRQARAQFRRSVATSVVEFNEYAFALRELDAMEK
jgi:lipoprotein NlpI/transglutaminase-like putative cysteine protease